MRNLSNSLISDIARREAMLAKIERMTELPLLVLAFVMVPLLVGPFLWEQSSAEEAIFITLDTFIWAIFVVDLGVKVAVAPNRLTYIKRHWLEVLIVAVPFFRPLRILRLFGMRGLVGFKRLVNVDFLIVYGIGLVMVAATIVTSVEAGNGGTIGSFPDALWWAVATITTVGYGDAVPATAAGRAVAFVLMIGGIAFFSGVTANLASFLVKSEDPAKATMAQLVEEIKLLRNEVGQLRRG